MRTARVDVVVVPALSVATEFMVSVAACVVSRSMVLTRAPFRNVRMPRLRSACGPVIVAPLVYVGRQVHAGELGEFKKDSSSEARLMQFFSSKSRTGALTRYSREYGALEHHRQERCLRPVGDDRSRSGLEN